MSKKQAQFDAVYNKVADPSDVEKKAAVQSIADMLKHQKKPHFDAETGFDNGGDGTAALESAAFLNHEEEVAEKNAKALGPTKEQAQAQKPS